MFGRKKTVEVATTAREALRYVVFPVELPGVRSLRVDYDPAVWVRLPRTGEDRTDWCARALAAHATDLEYAPTDPRYAVAEESLNRAADTLLTHTCDLMTLSDTDSGGGVAYVNVVDEELGLLEHGTPEVFIGMQDIKPDGRRPKAAWHPSARTPGAWLCSWDSLLDLQTGRREAIIRAHRTVQPPDAPVVHLYATGFYSRPTGIAQWLRLFHRSRLELVDGSIV